MEAKVFTGRDMLCKKDSCHFKKLGQRELWSYQMLLLQYIIHNCLFGSKCHVFVQKLLEGTGKGHILAN